MTIIKASGNIFDWPTQSLVVPVNTVGAMGAGLAKSFKLAYPGLFPEYQKACINNVFYDNGIFVYDHSPERKIICLPTKHHWEQDSDLALINFALLKLAEEYQRYGITEVAMPAIGSGLGNQDWGRIYNGIVHYFGDHPINMYVLVE